MQTALVLGGSGFVGTAIVQALLDEGWQVRIGARRPQRAAQRFDGLSTVQFMPAPIGDQAALTKAVEGADLVVNCVGILAEFGRQSFQAVQRDGAIHLAKIAAAAGVKTFIHISSLASDGASPSSYARTKAEAEVGIGHALPDAIILRPSLIFGPGDGFFHRFAHMARLSPFLPVVGDGLTKFQPVYVLDVARAVIAALNAPHARGQTYDLGGPHTYTFRQLMDYLVQTLPRRRFVMPLPMPMARLMAAATDWLPGAPLTREQLHLLAYDTLVGPQAVSLKDLGIDPTALEDVVPGYIS